jgi:hypothetical protein
MRLRLSTAWLLWAISGALVVPAASSLFGGFGFCEHWILGSGMVTFYDDPVTTAGVSSWQLGGLLTVQERFLKCFSLPKLFWRQSRGLAGEPKRIDIVACPLWVPIAVFSLAGILMWPHRRRMHVGGCASCGYDLTGNVSGRCPECGTEFEQRRRAGP